MTSGRRFVWNGHIVRFDFDSFDREFRREATLRAASLSQYETLLAQRLNVDSTTVHSWRMRRSGPSCLDVIHLLCSEWGIDMEGILAMDERTQEKERMPLCMDGLRDPQVDAIGRFYAEVIDYLDDFERTMGFNDYWFDFADSGVKHRIMRELNEQRLDFQHRLARVLSFKHTPVLDFRLDMRTELGDRVLELLNEEDSRRNE